MHSHSLFYWRIVGTGTEARGKNFPMVKEVSSRAENETHTSDFKPMGPHSTSHYPSTRCSICSFPIDERILYSQSRIGENFLEFGSCKFLVSNLFRAL